MSLFGTEFGKTVRSQSTTKTSKTQRLFGIADTQKLSCAQCPLDRVQLNTPKMVPSGSEAPLLYILGDAPGATDDEEGVQFIGKSGELVRNKVPSRYQRHIRWNNTIRCRPPGNRDPAPIELACCRRLQIQDIETTRPKIIIGFGGVPLSWMLGPDRAVTNWRGRRMPVQVGSHRCWFYPITDPTTILQKSGDKKTGPATKRCFERDLERVFADLDAGLPEPEIETEFHAGIECLHVYGSEGIKILTEALAHFSQLEHAIDLETDRLRPYHNDARIVSVAVGTYDEVIAFPYEHPEARWSPKELRIIHDMLEAYLLRSPKKWAHGAKFELEWFHKRYGPKILYETEWGDTLGQAHILDERRGKALDDLTQLHFGFRLKDLSPGVNLKNMAGTPLKYILPYNGMDSKYCHLLSIVQSGLLEEAGLTEVYEDRNRDTPSIIQMQAGGLVRDVEELKKLDKHLGRAGERVTAKIMADPDVIRFQKAGNKFSPTSNPDLVNFFRDFLRIPKRDAYRQGGAWHSGGGPAKSKDTGYPVDQEALDNIRHPIARAVLEMRAGEKNHGTYITPLLDGGKQVHGDGLLHPAFSQYVTSSGRLNSEDPNAQNFPRRKHKEIRRVITCPPGHTFCAFDYGQLEWRVGAMLSGDRAMGDEIKAKQDIHGRWTDEIGGMFVPALVKENRKKVRDSIKQYWTFANLYGNVLDAVARDLSSEFGVEISPRRLERFFNAFWDQYPRLREYQDKLMSTYAEKGYVVTGTGQRRHEPLARNEAINHPFQGTAGHLVLNAQRRLAHMAYCQDRPQLAPRLNVHDDLSFYLPDATIEEDVEAIAREMVAPSYNWVTVPLSVEFSRGANWCDKEEVATFYTGEI